MSIEAQLERLNQNIESLVGAIAANTSVAASIANGNTNQTTAVAAPAAADKPTRTRRTKEEIAADAAKEAKATEGTLPAATTEKLDEELTHADQQATQAEEDPFGDSAPATETKTYTLDDAREAGLKLKDVVGLDKARAFISTFGVDSIKDLPADKFGAFITKANAEAKKNTI